MPNTFSSAKKAAGYPLKPQAVFSIDPQSKTISILAFDGNTIKELKDLLVPHGLYDWAPPPYDYEEVHGRWHATMDQFLVSIGAEGAGYNSSGTTDHHLHMKCPDEGSAMRAVESLQVAKWITKHVAPEMAKAVHGMYVT